MLRQERWHWAVARELPGCFSRGGDAGMPIYCGIDWAETDHQVAVVDDVGELVAERRIGKDPAGLTKL